ncbi:hypothetical protein [Oceanivirga salmonicida]|uniref:hypothetical protein n=1 Tax=Oceanivirga salmonicida TaxID=1769291 RepID=UPI0012E16646|nr:hypothetical protein [Oceanivirga salmonicida]
MIPCYICAFKIILIIQSALCKLIEKYTENIIIDTLMFIFRRWVLHLIMVIPIVILGFGPTILGFMVSNPILRV